MWNISLEPTNTMIKKEGYEMVEHNTSKDIRKNAPKGDNPGQPAPMKGSKKVKQRNHVNQAHGE